MNLRSLVIGAAAAVVVSTATGIQPATAVASGGGVPVDALLGAPELRSSPWAGARPSQVAQPGPRHELRGDWQIAGIRYRFSGSGGLHRARTLHHARLGGCRIRRGTVVFAGYRFVAAQGSRDLWRGRATLPGPGCRRRAVAAPIAVASDLRFAVSSPGRTRLRARRIRPAVRSDDPVLGTWTLNDVDVVVQRATGGYEGIAREPFLIANGCTIEAGTILWAMRPLAPDRYDGTVERFRAPPGCARDLPAPSRWLLAANGSELVREDPQGNRFSYMRASGAAPSAALKKP